MLSGRRRVRNGMVLLVILAATSCLRAADQPTPKEPVVFYLDGAGGGGLLLNWGRNVAQGLRDAGFRGDFKNYDWQTGLGPLLDHTMSEQDKRDAGRKLAGAIQDYMAAHPGTPIHLIGLSAGTAVLVYALEQLSSDRQVDNVVLLSSSMDAQYDLTRALRRVRGKMYVFTSAHDPVLNSLIPMMGTADRTFRLRSIAGLQGFTPLDNAGAETRQLYSSKVANIPWRQDFALTGNFGSHTGPTTPAFVERYIAPLIMRGKPPEQPQNKAWPFTWPRAGR